MNCARFSRGGSIPQAVWIACNSHQIRSRNFPVWFQYRKRYGLHAIEKRYDQALGYDPVSIPQAVWIACNVGRFVSLRWAGSFNTASGMDCMQLFPHPSLMRRLGCFNTASGMDCMQSFSHQLQQRLFEVSIPQAVWIACNVCAEVFCWFL